MNGANRTKSEPRDQSTASSAGKEKPNLSLRTHKDMNSVETGGQRSSENEQQQQQRQQQQQVVEGAAAVSIVKAASMEHKDQLPDKQQVIEKENENENSQVVDWSSDDRNRLNGGPNGGSGKEEGSCSEKNSASEKSDTCCSFSRTSQSALLEAKEGAGELEAEGERDREKADLESFPMLPTTPIETETSSSGTCETAQVSTRRMSHDNNHSSSLDDINLSSACAEEAAQIDWQQSRLSCRELDNNSSSDNSKQQQQHQQVDDDTESHEIVIDSNSMSRFEESPIRVRDVESDTTKAGQTKDKLSQNVINEPKMLITSFAPNHQLQDRNETVEQEEAASADERSQKLVTQISKMDTNRHHQQQLINEAARRNDLVKFFSHYKGKFEHN